MTVPLKSSILASSQLQVLETNDFVHSTAGMDDTTVCRPSIIHTSFLIIALFTMITE